MTNPRKNFSRTIPSHSFNRTARMTAEQWLAALLLLACFFLMACEGSTPEAPTEPTENAATMTDPTEIAQQTIADFLSLPISEITPVSMEARDFADASLDCPAAGMSYAQVITPGYRVVVEAEGRRFDVRVSGTSGRICRQPANPDRPIEPSPERSGTPHSATR